MRKKILAISGGLFTRLFSEGMPRIFEVVSDGVPADAVMRDCRLTHFTSEEGGVVEILLESKEFPDVAPGEPFPIFAPLVRVINNASLKEAYVAGFIDRDGGNLNAQVSFDAWLTEKAEPERTARP